MGKSFLGGELVQKASWGLGPDVHCTNGSVMEMFEVESITDFDVKIVAMEARMAHVVVFIWNGRVYGLGSCRKGQLGETFK